MATQAIAATTARAPLLRRALLANAIFSELSGLAFLIGAGPLAALIGLGAAWPLMVLGAGVLFFGILVFFEARREPLHIGRARAILALDIAWVLASGALLLLNPLGLTSAGWWLVAGIADVVAVLAVLEYLGLRRLRG